MFFKRGAVFALVIMAILSFAACGRRGSDGVWIYVPEFIDFEEKNIAFDTMLLSGDAIYFFKSDKKGDKAWEQGFFRYSPEDGQAVSIPLNRRDEGTAETVRHFFVSEDGIIYVLSWVDTPVYGSGEISGASWFLHKAENDDGIMSIINEEAAAFFAGQKTVDEAAALIQNRISIYVSERM